MPEISFGKIQCDGCEFPAKVLNTFARPARLDVDLGFGLSYRGIVELDGTEEPAKPVPEWHGKASEALRRRIDGRLSTICFVDGNGKRAYFYLDDVDINRQMVEEGCLDPMRFPPFGISSDF